MNTKVSLTAITSVLFLISLVKIPSVYSQTQAWGVVYGADRDIQDAYYEIRLIRKNLDLSAELFKKEGKYRSVVKFNSEAEARKKLPIITQKYPERKPYVIDLNKWCPNWSQKKEDLDGISYHTCK